MEQLEFSFIPECDKFNINNFITFKGNLEAYSFIKNSNAFLSLQGNNLFFLSGPNKSGKTYLANIWKNLNNAKLIPFKLLQELNTEDFNLYINSVVEQYDNYIIDDFNIKNISEIKLLNLFNVVIGNKSNLLIINKESIKNLNFSIKDLDSRIESCIKLEIKQITSEIKHMFLVKLLADKQFRLKSYIENYISKTLPNSYEAIFKFVQKLSITASQTNHKITIPFIKHFVL